MIEKLGSIEWDAAQHSYIHNLDARVKIILVFLLIILVVAYPLSTGIIYIAVPFFCILITLWKFSTLPFVTYFSRVILTLPFGFFIIFFQIFFKNPHYLTATEINLPFPFFSVYYESVEFASILLIKFLLCVSAIILLSSTTPVQEILKAGKQLGLPSVMALSLGMMIRYLFLFAGMFSQIHHSLICRNFNPQNKSLPYRYRLKTLGYAMGVLFLRSYEQGERTYTAMLCRGYGSHIFEQVHTKPLNRNDKIVLSSLGVLMPLMTLAIFCMTSFK